MIFDHSVKINGKWFKAGEEVILSPALTSEAAKVVADDTVVNKVEDDKPVPKRSYTKRK